ncbi:MAG TPA: YHS domain-containing protein [Ginsengibacter sp.]
MKNMSILFSFLVIAGLVISCGDRQSVKNPEPEVASVTNADTIKITAAMVDNKKDPSCGMPVSAGIGDTAHYKGKVLGFCSKECKDEFLKDPEKNITAADLKK